MTAASTQLMPRVVVDLAVALMIVAASAVTAEILHALLGLTRLAMLFLAAVVVTATIRGARAGLLAAAIGVPFYKFFLDLRTGEQTALAEDLLNLLTFLIVALITGTLAGRMHDEAQRARTRADRMALLLKTSRILSEEEHGGLWEVLAKTLAEASKCGAMVFDGEGTLQARSSDAGPDSVVRKIVEDLLRHDADSVKKTASWSARPIRADARNVGVIVWQSGEVDPEIDDVVELLAELASAAITRRRVRDEEVRIQAAEEAGRMRETILSSISHDFRSPLSAIIGSSTSLLEYGDQFDAEVRKDLLLNIRDEGEKLNDFVANLLNMSRLQSGAIQVARKPLSVDQVARSAVERLQRHKGRSFHVEFDGACGANADPMLLEQALYNILDNAVKYGGSAPVQIRCRPIDDGCEITVADGGPGLAKKDQLTAFGKFSGPGVNARADSTGLGLYIAKGFIEAIGGSIEARDRADGASGLEMVIKLRGARS